MIISKKYAERLIKQGSATVECAVTENGNDYTAITRSDLQRTDHVECDYRDLLATELLVGCPAESLADHKKIAAAIRNGDSVSDVEDLCGDFYPETAIWVRNRLS
jgi:hypothetical protein